MPPVYPGSCNAGSNLYGDTVTADVDTVACQAARYFLKRRIPWAVDDLTQQARLIAWTVVTRHPDRAANPGYLFGATRKGLGNYITKSLAVVSIGDSRCIRDGRTTAAAVQARVSEQKASLLASNTASPELALLRKEGARGLSWWRIQLRRALDTALRGFDDEEREIIERLFGFDGLPSLEPRKIAEQRGISVRNVYQIRSRLMGRIRDDLVFRLLDRKLDELQEYQP